MALACDSRGREFNSRPFRCQVTTLDKLFNGFNNEESLDQDTEILSKRRFALSRSVNRNNILIVSTSITRNK